MVYNNYKYYLSRDRNESTTVVDPSLGNSTTEITKRIHGRMITYYKRHVFRLFEPDSWCFCLYLSENEARVSNELSKLITYFTKESIKRTLRQYPTIMKLFLEDGDLQLFLGGENRPYLWRHIRGNSTYVSSQESNCVNQLLEIVVKLEKECSHFQYNPRSLVLTELKKRQIESEIERRKNPRPQPSNNSTSNPQVGRYLVIAGIIGLKCIAKSIGAELDLQIPADAPDIPDIDDSYGFNQLDFADSDSQDIYNVSFLGRDTLPSNANSDGYNPDGSISLTRTISNTTDTFKHFTKDGHDYILYHGSYIRVDGDGTVNIGGVSYDKK